MKANQKFREADEAVSPVIGVILMVAITVVLAAVVFVLVSDLGGESSSAPAMSWSQSETNDRATVSSAAPGTTWDEFALSTSSTGIQYGINQDANTAVGGNQIVGTAVAGGDASVAINAGDFIDFCSSTTGASAEITMRHIDSNSVVKTFSFQSLDAC